ncbi:MAG: hypothetical protein UHS47_00975 [Oscillospiraceae bacterium]|nr:hypothetical protein [Oscillospiraceae bacterium]
MEKTCKFCKLCYNTNEQAKYYAISPATAAKGVNILVDKGILYKKRGIGMFVATGAVELCPCFFCLKRENDMF